MAFDEATVVKSLDYRIKLTKSVTGKYGWEITVGRNKGDLTDGTAEMDKVFSDAGYLNSACNTQWGQGE